MSRSPLPPDLVSRAVAGDREARRGLLDRYGPMVYGVCVATDPEPDDAYQEIWEKAFRALSAFDPAGTATLSTWLYQVAHHQLVDRGRRKRVRSVVEPLDHDPGIDGGQVEAVAREQSSRQLREALACLPDAQRRAVVFHYLEELPLERVAEREGVPVGTVKSRLHQGRGRLLQLLGGGR